MRQGTLLDMDEITAWQEGFWTRRATSAVPTPGGTGVLTPAFSRAHDHNKLIVRAACEADPLAEAADDVLAGLSHRRIEVAPIVLVNELESGLAQHGYARDDELIMGFEGTATSRGGVEVLDLAERSRVSTREWQREQPEWEPEAWRQLGHRGETAVRACEATFLGVRDEQGAVVAHADLYLYGGIGQVEEVMTDPAHRGRGHASRLVLDAVAQAQAAGARRVFLVADVDDWPKELYRRLGFVDLGTTATFSRSQV